MNFKEHLEVEPQKYWQPPKGNTYAQQVLANPEKFPQYTFTPKMDGEWNKLMWDGEHMYMLARARNVQGVFTDRWEKFPHIIEELKDLPAYTILLGEVAFDDITKTSKDVGSVMRSLVPRALDIQKKTPLHFYVFDCLMWDGKDLSNLSYQDRFHKNAELFYYMQGKEVAAMAQGYVHILYPKNMDELVPYLEDYFARGGEGVVLIDRNSKYAFGSRPVRDSVKIKKQLDEFEALVLSTLEPTKEYTGKEIETWKFWMERGESLSDGTFKWYQAERNCFTDYQHNPHIFIPVTKPYYYGWKNALHCDYDGRIFDVASGLNDADRAWLATEEAQELIKAGKLYAVCGAMELTKDSVRHPYLVRLRNDM